MAFNPYKPSYAHLTSKKASGNGLKSCRKTVEIILVCVLKTLSDFVSKKRIIIIGAAGRDFHIFNTIFRKDSSFDVVAFTAAQIPFITNRIYPKELSGALYPNGIKIYDESELPKLIRTLKVDICILAYSDLSYQQVMDKASVVNALGADFWLIAPERTMLKSSQASNSHLRCKDRGRQEPDK